MGGVYFCNTHYHWLNFIYSSMPDHPVFYGVYLLQKRSVWACRDWWCILEGRYYKKWKTAPGGCLLRQPALCMFYDFSFVNISYPLKYVVKFQILNAEFEGESSSGVLTFKGNHNIIRMNVYSIWLNVSKLLKNTFPQCSQWLGISQINLQINYDFLEKFQYL